MMTSKTTLNKILITIDSKISLHILTTESISPILGRFEDDTRADKSGR